jgi:hypothetical protein
MTNQTQFCILEFLGSLGLRFLGPCVHEYLSILQNKAKLFLCGSLCFSGKKCKIERSEIPAARRDKAKLLRFQSNIKDCSKNKPKIERSLPRWHGGEAPNSLRETKRTQIRHSRVPFHLNKLQLYNYAAMYFRDVCSAISQHFRALMALPGFLSSWHFTKRTHFQNQTVNYNLIYTNNLWHTSIKSITKITNPKQTHLIP